MSDLKEYYRDRCAADCYKNARESLPKITKGLSAFLLTRGQFSLVDAILVILDDIGPATLSVWTWSVATYDLLVLRRLFRDGKITSGLLVLSSATLRTRPGLEHDLRGWVGTFGPESLKVLINHAKIVTLETEDFKIFMHGSPNLNFNLRFEQLQIEEGHPGFDAIRQVENETPALPLGTSDADLEVVSGLSDYSEVSLGGFEPFKMETIKTWKKMKPNVDRLKRLGASDELLQIYADAVALYNEAAENVAENGAVVAHPRTGAPIENPYNRVRAAASKQILDIERALKKPKQNARRRLLKL